jgi:ABC-2 type transport system permease protein
VSALASLWRGLWRADYSAALYRLLRFNPCVTAHELRMRMRGFRMFWVLFLYAGVAAAVFLITMWAAAWQHASTSMPQAQRAPGALQPGLGRTVLTVVSYVQLALVLLILPAYSAGAITMEREKRTLEMLRATLLSPFDVVTGKWLVVLGIGVVLLLSSLPVAAWCLALGGVAPEDLLLIYSYLLVVAAFASALGMFLSSVLRRSLGAIVWTYGALIALIVVPFIVVAIAAAGPGRGGNPTGIGFGVIWAWILLLVAMPACAWLLFLAVRWPWRRLLPRRWAGAGGVAGGLAAAVLLVWAFRPSGSLAGSLAHLPMMWIFITDPFVVLSAILAGEGLLSQVAGVGLLPRSAIPLQTLIWMVGTAWALVASAFLWAAAVRAYRARE